MGLQRPLPRPSTNERGAAPAGPGERSGAGFGLQSPTAVRYLTSAQLQAVLRGRGVRLPEGGAQSHAYYVELCRSQGLLEVTAAELTGGAPAAAAGTGGSEGGDGAGLAGLETVAAAMVLSYLPGLRDALARLVSALCAACREAAAEGSVGGAEREALRGAAAGLEQVS